VCCATIEIPNRTIAETENLTLDRSCVLICGLELLRATPLTMCKLSSCETVFTPPRKDVISVKNLSARTASMPPTCELAFTTIDGASMMQSVLHGQEGKQLGGLHTSSKGLKHALNALPEPHQQRVTAFNGRIRRAVLQRIVPVCSVRSRELRACMHT
jgi:hypothetical protein